MTLLLDPARPLQGKRVAFIFGPGNIGVDYAAALVRGPERALLELGADARTFNYALVADAIRAFEATRPDPARDRYPERSALVRELVAFLQQEGPFDLTLGSFYDVCLAAPVEEALRKRGGHLINYPLNLLDQPRHFARAVALFDQTFCAEEDALPALGAKGRYVPMASDPFLFRPVGVPARPRLLFVGSAYGPRQEALARCAQVIDTTALGSGFGLARTARALGRAVLRERRLPSLRPLREALLRDRRPAGDEAFVRLAAEHGVSVGFSDVRQEGTGALLHKVRLREYDAPMAGLCHLARRLPELERHFAAGREMILYDSLDELPGLLARIRRGELDWRGIGAAARLRAARDHTWTQRLRAAFRS